MKTIHPPVSLSPALCLQKNSRCCRQSTHKISEVLLPLRPWSELPSLIVMRECQEEHVGATSTTTPAFVWRKPRVSVCSGNSELDSQFDSAGIDFWSPNDVFNAARHRVDSSHSAACLVRAAFDPGGRNGKENEERLQACWDWRYCRWSSITLKFWGYCVGFNFLNTKKKSAKASTLRRATIRHPHTPSSMCPINMLACEIPLTNTTRTLTLIPLQRSVRCQECFIINHTLCRRRCALHSAADVANWQ